MTSGGTALLGHIESLQARSRDGELHLGIDKGASGVAYAACIIGRRDDDARLVRAAYQLLRVNRDAVLRPTSFAMGEDIIHADDVRPYFNRSVLYGEPGFWFVLALLASSVGDRETAAASARELAVLCGDPYPFGEFHFGSSGALWAAAVLLAHDAAGSAAPEVATLARCLLSAAWSQYHGDEQTRSLFALGEYGFAHGRAGMLFAILRASMALGIEPPDGMLGALEALACRGEVTARGISWPSCDHPLPPPVAGVAESWCNGATGFVSLWALAYETYRDEVFRDLAIKAACFVAGNTSGARESLCCGFAGHLMAYTTADKLQPGGPWAGLLDRVATFLESKMVPLTTENHGLLKGKAGELLRGTPWL